VIAKEFSGKWLLASDPPRRAGGRRVPQWEEFNYTPYVFVRVANKRLTAYGKWKSAQGNEFNGLVFYTFLEGTGWKRPERALGWEIFNKDIAGHTEK
jgi:hypothetical protein